MSETIPYIILTLLIVFLELIQIKCTKFKVRKWILPLLSFLLSLLIMIYLICFELSNQIGIDRNNLMKVNISTWMMFPALNIPTIIFLITNIICNKLNNGK